MDNQTGNAVADTREFSTVTEASGSEYGQIRINNNVIAIIAHETAKKVPGVVELQGSLADDLAGMIGKKSKDKGIRIEKENEELLTIDLTVVLEFGVRIPDICVQLQSAVKKSVEDMTGQQVYGVNVVVQGIRSKDEKKTEE
ncbi:MAG: Asp23/Gls24 family envelope stress response protein [Pontiella sp.]|nr:Asp23/Gls24 family envelope stress response protein [Pontiella sp.]MBT8046438.1 Asp23/Gls24 family envelope stress response protein [Pontiella sp.]NNJ70128.1 Asp23/Gls24 family envelope stress response protein [Kiritimatiellales bacterium]